MNQCSTETLWVGLDVHQNSITAAILAGEAQEPVVQRLSGDPALPDSVFIEDTAVILDEVAIVGMPDERLGERSCAFVSLHEGQSLSFEQLKDFLNGRKLARQYLPEKLVIIDSMPKTPVGKIQKFKLRELAESMRPT